jgi:hypothetical protein
LTLNIPDDLYESLVRIAGQTRQSPDELAVAWLTQGVRGFEEDPLLKLAGCIELGPGHPALTDGPVADLSPGPGPSEGNRTGHGG